MGVPSPTADPSTVTVTWSGEWFVARDDETGVTTQGETRATALKNLGEALELHDRPVSEDADDPVESSDAPWF